MNMQLYSRRPHPFSGKGLVLYNATVCSRPDFRGVLPPKPGFYLENFFGGGGGGGGGSLNNVYGGAQRFCKGCMERCITDPFHIKMHFLSFGSNKTNC